MAYATAADVRRWLDVDSAGDDTLINDLISQVQRLIDEELETTFEVSADSTRVFDARGPHIDGRVLRLDRLLASITTVTNGDGVEVSSSEYTTVPRNDAPYTGIELLPSSDKDWEYSGDDWQGAIEVEGKWGYSATVPGAIKQATAQWAAHLYRLKDLQPGNVTILAEGVQINNTTMPEQVRHTLTLFNKQKRRPMWI